MARALSGGLMLLILFGSVAWAQTAEVRALNERLQRLERDLRTLERGAYRGEAPPPSATGAAGAPSAGSLADA